MRIQWNFKPGTNPTFNSQIVSSEFCNLNLNEFFSLSMRTFLCSSSWALSGSLVHLHLYTHTHLYIYMNPSIQHTNRIAFYWSHLESNTKTNEKENNYNNNNNNYNSNNKWWDLPHRNIYNHHCLYRKLSPSLQGIPSLAAWQTLKTCQQQHTHTHKKQHSDTYTQPLECVTKRATLTTT